MATANVMTFDDRDEPIRVKSEEGAIYVYWDIGTYLRLNHAEAATLRDELSKAIEAAPLQAPESNEAQS